jgi:F-type H+-transporting ATPase subunit gamma
MASLKDLRVRINSVRSTQKITRAMQMVAASKLRRAQEQAEAGRPYANHMRRMISSLMSALTNPDDAPDLMVGRGEATVHLLVVATSERGLCGSFNTNIVRRARLRISTLLHSGHEVKILCIGKKGRDMLRRDYDVHIIDTIDMSEVRRLGFSDVAPIAERITDMFAAGEFDACSLFFSQFKSVLSQEVTEHQLIPVSVPEVSEEDVPLEGVDAMYEYEPEEDEILAELLPRNLAVQVYSALLENAASEQGARMTAMDNATRNAGEMIDKLTLVYNRTRQAIITKELIEIISGAEAL